MCGISSDVATVPDYFADDPMLHCAERNQLMWFMYVIRMLPGHIRVELFWACPTGWTVWGKGRLATLLISVLPPCARPIMAEKTDRYRWMDILMNLNENNMNENVKFLNFTDSSSRDVEVVSRCGKNVSPDKVPLPGD